MKSSGIVNLQKNTNDMKLNISIEVNISIDIFIISLRLFALTISRLLLLFILTITQLSLNDILDDYLLYLLLAGKKPRFSGNMDLLPLLGSKSLTKATW